LRHGRQIPDRLASGDVGPGLLPMLIRLHTELAALAPGYRVEEFGTEFGRLSLQVTDGYDAEDEFDGVFADEAAALVDAAVLASQTTCEECGGEGRARFRGDQRRTWIRTPCEHCRTSREPGLHLREVPDHAVHGGDQ
jgi:hypothetical protein